MDLIKEQRVAYRHILDDIYDGKKEVTLGGLAGTGKTTVIKHLADHFSNYAVCAYTGKAANILRRKGIDAKTIHSTIYRPIKDSDPVQFELNPMAPASGLIVDEASMVPSTIHKDIKSYGIPVVYVGDHGQLEPIGNSFNLMKCPDYKLEFIHRNSGDIPRFAMHLREGGKAEDFTVEDGSLEIVDSIDPTHYNDYDQVICGFNSMRSGINKACRSNRQFYLPLHEEDKIICLKNNAEECLYNGMQGVLTGHNIRRKKHTLSFCANDLHFSDVWYDPDVFGSSAAPKWNGKKGANQFDYAYAITVHKAQGDEFGSVLVIEQSSHLWDQQRWAYTAASRARERLVWIKE